MRVLLLSALLLGSTLPQAQQPKITEPLYTVVFCFKEKNMFDPSCRIYISVHAPNEGTAAIRANKYISEKLSIPAAEALEFVEAQERKPDK